MLSVYPSLGTCPDRTQYFETAKVSGTALRTKPGLQK